MSKVKSIIKTQVTPKSLVIENTSTGSVITVSVEGKGKVVATKSAAKGTKEDQYATYITKFVKELVGQRMPKSLSYGARLKKVNAVVETLSAASSFRLLSNRLRRSFDDGKYYPQGTYFYEGMKTPEDTK